MRVLVAPLDWGLGHATRCLPVIEALRGFGVEPLLGCAGAAGALLQAESPDLPYVDLPSYNIRYPSKSMTFGIARQMPRILATMRQEHLILQQLLKRHDISGVISDNRYGLYNHKVPTVLLTHQLQLRVPFRPIAPLVNKVLGHWINRFDACWIPDHEERPGLAGELSHPPRHKQTSYIGPLSRFRAGLSASAEYDILCLLSGPEPQRSRLEELLKPQLRESGKRVLLVRGNLERDSESTEGDIDIRDHLLADDLNEAMASCRLLLARPGYSTIMDLHRTGGKAIFIPTPGQTEQEYLADILHREGVCYRHAQEGFRLNEALREQEKFIGFPEGKNERSPSRLEEVLLGWLGQLN